LVSTNALPGSEQSLHHKLTHRYSLEILSNSTINGSAGGQIQKKALVVVGFLPSNLPVSKGSDSKGLAAQLLRPKVGELNPVLNSEMIQFGENHRIRAGEDIAPRNRSPNAASKGSLS